MTKDTEWKGANDGIGRFLGISAGLTIPVDGARGLGVLFDANYLASEARSGLEALGKRLWQTIHPTDNLMIIPGYGLVLFTQDFRHGRVQ